MRPAITPEVAWRALDVSTAGGAAACVVVVGREPGEPSESFAVLDGHTGRLVAKARSMRTAA